MAGQISIRVTLSGLNEIIPRHVPEGATLGELKLTLDGWNPDSSQQVLVNGSAKTDGYKLQEGDSVTITPKNMKGAIAA